MSGAVARRYTAGLFEYANEHGVVNVVDQGLRLIADALAAEPQFRALVEHPVITGTEKSAMIDNVFQNAVDPVVLRFVHLLVKRGRTDSLIAIAEQFHTLAESAKGVVEVKVESAFPMNDAQIQQLESELTQALGRKATAVVTVNSDLFAGYRAQIGHRVLDATLQSSLRQFSHKLLAKA